MKQIIVNDSNIPQGDLKNPKTISYENIIKHTLCSKSLYMPWKQNSIITLHFNKCSLDSFEKEFFAGLILGIFQLLIKFWFAVTFSLWLDY